MKLKYFRHFFSFLHFLLRSTTTNKAKKEKTTNISLQKENEKKEKK